MYARKTPNPREPDHVKKAKEAAFTKVNEIIFEEMNAWFKAHPSADMTGLLEHKYKTYPAMRKAFGDGAVRDASHAEPTVGSSDAKDRFQIPADVEVVRPLEATVLKAVQASPSPGQTDSDLSATIDGLNRLLASSEFIWRLGSTTVLGLNSELILKIRNDINISHIHTLDYIKQQVPNTPMPKIHGILQQSDTKRILLFMSRVPGEPLDTKWELLNREQKISIKLQLGAIIEGFRSIPAPPAEEANAVLGGGNPRRCIDTRRQVRVATGPISDEVEFNQFLVSTSNSKSTRFECGGMDMIEFYLDSSSHKIVMTHGDLHPRNIMVTTDPRLSDRDAAGEAPSQEALGTMSGTSRLSSSQVTVTGILDWEMCGWYPEYWEYVKALNTIPIGSVEFGDWWRYLPDNVGVWPKEHAVDMMLR